jgi:hypothetical protein
MYTKSRINELEINLSIVILNDIIIHHGGRNVLF